MVETRSRTNSIPIKEEVSDRELKNTLLLHDTSNANNNGNRATKKKPNKNKNKAAYTSSRIKQEDEEEEKIRQLIIYVKNDNMSVLAASKKINISYSTVRKYYNTILMETNRKVFLSTDRNQKHTHQQIKTLIECIVDNRLPIAEASLKANMSQRVGYAYYKEYREDPNHNFPTPHHLRPRHQKIITQDQIDELIGYIVNEKLSVDKASFKVKMSNSTGKKYYHQYLNDHKIPTAKGIVTSKEQIVKMIDYVDNDNCTIAEAARRVNMNKATAYRHYRLYKAKE